MRAHLTSLAGTALALLSAGAANAVNVNLSGDLGLNNWHTTPGPLPVGQSIGPISIFQSVPGVGDLSADVYVDNSGVNGVGNNLFSMKITNLVFQAYAASPLTPTNVTLTMTQTFVLTHLGPQLTLHGLDGVMSASGYGVVLGQTAVGPNAFGSITNLGYAGGNAGAVDMFNVGPFLGMYSTMSPFLGIKMQLDLTIFGSGFINMPSSFEAVTESVPAPGAGVAFIVAIAGGVSRRRRSV